MSLRSLSYGTAIEPALSLRRIARSRIWVSIPETAAALLLLIAGGAHGWLVRNAWNEAHDKGVWFGLHALLCLLCALNLRWGDRLIGWLLGALVCAISLVVHVLSSAAASGAVALGAWLAPSGVLWVSAELGFLLVFARAFVYDDEKDEL